MPETLQNFEHMWAAYPNPGEPASEAKRTIGGAVNASWILNTCVVRVSRAFNASGNRIPNRRGDEIFTVRGGDGLNYALRVREFRRYLRRRYGRPELHQSNDGPGGSVPPSFAGRRGVIVFDVRGWSDATGHVDLWDGTECRHAEYFEVAAAVYLWPVTDDVVIPTPRLQGSVGRGGANRSEDVVRVQERLVALGHDGGEEAGVVDARTIAAVENVQAGFMRRPDGRVDPGGRTWRELLEL